MLLKAIFSTGSRICIYKRAGPHPGVNSTPSRREGRGGYGTPPLVCGGATKAKDLSQLEGVASGCNVIPLHIPESETGLLSTFVLTNAAVRGLHRVHG